MAEEFHILNPPAQTEGGIEIPDEAFDAIQVVADNIDDVQKVAGAIDDEGNLVAGSVDGNVGEIIIKFRTEADWGINDEVLAAGEFGWIIDAAPKVLKLGDGVTLFSALTNLLESTVEGDLGALVDQAEAAATAAAASAATADTHRSAAQGAQADAEAAALLAQQWASAPASVILPGDKLSAEVYADQARVTALGSRVIDTRACAGNETFGSGMLYKKSLYAGASLATITFPADAYTSSDANKEAWAIYRKDGTGDVKFVASGAGTGLAAPTIRAQGIGPYRVKNPPSGASVSYNVVMAVPPVTDGKLVLVVSGHSSEVGTKTCDITLSGSMVDTTKLAVTQGVQLESSWAVFEADLLAYAGGDITATVSFGTMANMIQTFWFAIEGHGGAMFVPVPKVNSAAAASLASSITTVPAQSLVIAVAVMRGQSTNVGFSSFSANMATIRSGNIDGAPDSTVSSTTENKNSCHGVGAGVAATTADFAIYANFNSAFNRPCLLMFGYPPKTSAGAGAVTLKLVGGRDTLSQQNAEALLTFTPDGKTVRVSIPPA